MTVDSTLQFAQRRNIPVRYNRDLVARTLEAMSRVSEIRAKRERQFYRNRMQGNRAKQLEADRKLVAENQHLLPPQYRDQITETLAEEAVPAGMELEGEDLELTVEEQQRLAAEQKVAASKVSGKSECNNRLSWHAFIRSPALALGGVSGERCSKWWYGLNQSCSSCWVGRRNDCAFHTLHESIYETQYHYDQHHSCVLKCCCQVGLTIPYNVPAKYPSVLTVSYSDKPLSTTRVLIRSILLKAASPVLRPRSAFAGLSPPHLYYDTGRRYHDVHVRYQKLTTEGRNPQSTSPQDLESHIVTNVTWTRSLTPSTFLHCLYWRILLLRIYCV
jgi:hypothetical protein